MNKVILIGRVARDGELRYTQSGTGNCSFTIAVDRPFTKSEGKDKQADFINCVAWGKTAEHVAQWFPKGTPIAAEGRINVRSFEKDGQTKWVTEVVVERTEFVAPKKADATQVEIDDDLPFDLD